MSRVKEATFYDDHPFDWFESYQGEDRRKVISALLLEVIDALPRNALVLDVGCGPGRVHRTGPQREFNFTDCFALQITGRGGG